LLKVTGAFAFPSAARASEEKTGPESASSSAPPKTPTTFTAP
jgi:hypothetical protein